jgi:hypothetical protein
MYIRKPVYLPFKKNRTDYYIIKIDAVVGFSISTENNWLDVEKNEVTTRVVIPVGEYTAPELILRALKRAINGSAAINTDISFSIDSLTRQLVATYSGTENISFKFSPVETGSLRLALGFPGTVTTYSFEALSANNYKLISPGSIPTSNGSLFQSPYDGPPISDEGDPPDNLPELFPFRSGNITQGIVREIRKYTFNFFTATFLSPPNNDETNPGGELVSGSYVVKEGSTQINFDKNNPQPATIISFIPNQDFTIEKERPVKANITAPDYARDPSWSGNISAIKRRQSEHFQKAPGSSGRPLFVKYNAYGQIFFTVYGSRIRALDEVRSIIYKPEKPKDVLMGTYTKYFDSGRVWKIENYTNPTYSEDPEAAVLDSVLQGPFVEFYKNGNIRAEATFINNFLNGAYREYYQNGFISCQGTLLNGKLEGEYTQWDEEGNRKFKAFYVNGTLDNSYVLDYSL